MATLPEEWRRFAEALRKEDREVFLEMIQLGETEACKLSSNEAPKEQLSSIAILFAQHKLIRDHVEMARKIKSKLKTDPTAPEG